MPTQLRANLCTDNVTVMSLWKIILNSRCFCRKNRQIKMRPAKSEENLNVKCAIGQTKKLIIEEASQLLERRREKFTQVLVIFRLWCRDLHRVESVLAVHCIAGFYALKSGDLLR
ncbi:hypothetical protein PUN28_001853 [Cardiocondyla obscurior]|uniref:Uncharacterized protein n=1 Tax=Cardiocondyla obscurior TaxID=286306 RepID=A0AAW2GRN6_9HYME